MQNKGFSLVELMVAIAIVGIVASIALPNLSGFIAATRVTAQANDLVAALSIGRSEAVKRNASVDVCPSSDGAACSASTNWSSGWIVRLSSDISVLRVYPALSSGSTLTAGSAQFVTFSPNGQVAQSESFNLCGTGSRNIQISISGRVKTTNPGSC